jgi:hypothetical protein
MQIRDGMLCVLSDDMNEIVYMNALPSSFFLPSLHLPQLNRRNPFGHSPPTQHVLPLKLVLLKHLHHIARHQAQVVFRQHLVVRSEVGGVEGEVFEQR